MAVVEAVLVYRTDGIATDESVPVARTSDPEVLRTMRDRLLSRAADEVAWWTQFDPAIGAMKAADAQRLAAILGFLIPAGELRPQLQIVRNDAGQSDPVDG
jgi:hypothetical protein